MVSCSVAVRSVTRVSSAPRSSRISVSSRSVSSMLLAQVGVDANQADGARARDLADVHERGKQSRDHQTRDQRHGRPLVADTVDQHRRGVHRHRPRRTQAEPDLCGSPEPAGLRLCVAGKRREQLLAPAEDADRVARGAVLEHAAQRDGRLEQREEHARLLRKSALQNRHAERGAPICEPDRADQGLGRSRSRLGREASQGIARLRRAGAFVDTSAAVDAHQGAEGGVVREEVLRLVLPARRAFSSLRLGDVGPVAHRTELLVLDLGPDHAGENAGDRSCVGLELGVLLALEASARAGTRRRRRGQR